MSTLLVVQNERDLQMVKRYFNDLKFNYVVENHFNSVRKLEGLMFTQVYYTHEVMIEGMNRLVFEILYNTLIRMSSKPTDGFRLIG
jgi:hypothetical protein